MCRVWPRQKGGGTSQFLEAKGVYSLPEASFCLLHPAGWGLTSKLCRVPVPHPIPHVFTPHHSPCAGKQLQGSQSSGSRLLVSLYLRVQLKPIVSKFKVLPTQSFIPISLPALPGVQDHQCSTTILGKPGMSSPHICPTLHP